ncbi:expressed unknown protein [Seminavis robusta]|uniref:Uncharacterized protein n=1 Tax=Seminavis robusta TaxID=568900 RepID=A0A9N8DVK9_9STRA|nr:expressed unknown protein [Seminavis robusta]|eukprot:Sro385_g131580.1 n/a (532) ;mRNA; f:6479-8074
MKRHQKVDGDEADSKSKQLGMDGINGEVEDGDEADSISKFVDTDSYVSNNKKLDGDDAQSKSRFEDDDTESKSSSSILTKTSVFTTKSTTTAVTCVEDLLEGGNLVAGDAHGRQPTRRNTLFVMELPGRLQRRPAIQPTRLSFPGAFRIGSNSNNDVISDSGSGRQYQTWLARQNPDAPDSIILVPRASLVSDDASVSSLGTGPGQQQYIFEASLVRGNIAPEDAVIMSRRKVKVILVIIVALILSLATALLIAMTQMDRTVPLATFAPGNGSATEAPRAPTSTVPVPVPVTVNLPGPEVFTTIPSTTTASSTPSTESPSGHSTAESAGIQNTDSPSPPNAPNLEGETLANFDGVLQEGGDHGDDGPITVISADTIPPLPSSHPTSDSDYEDEYKPSTQPSVTPSKIPSVAPSEVVTSLPTREITFLEALEALTPTPVQPTPTPTLEPSGTPTDVETTNKPSSTPSLPPVKPPTASTISPVPPVNIPFPTTEIPSRQPATVQPLPSTLPPSTDPPTTDPPQQCRFVEWSNV